MTTRTVTVTINENILVSILNMIAEEGDIGDYRAPIDTFFEKMVAQNNLNDEVDKLYKGEIE